MQIVVNMPEKVVRAIQNGQDYRYDIHTAIAQGIPLPKGHGDLIDRDKLNLDHEVSMADDWQAAHEIANCVKYAPTVIEADK